MDDALYTVLPCPSPMFADYQNQMRKLEKYLKDER